MKKTTFLIGSIALLGYTAPAQDTAQSETKIDKSEVELVYNHYIQDGNRSAVTGGIGTEALTVYGPAVNIKRSRNKNALSFNVGTDIITSASIDNIDIIKSSASYTDIHAYTYGILEHALRKDLTIYGGMGFSVESDYFSYSGRIGFTKEDTKRQRTYHADLQVFNDDLRWGRINESYFKAETLIYPAELRYKEWYDVYKRYSYNLKLGVTQIINKRNVFGIYPELTYQQGLLSTPFHRIYFSDGSLAVEQLPESRLKAALALKWNSFSGGRVVLKNTVNGYTDDFGIHALALENETAIKLNREVTLLPNARIYFQKGSPYFKPYKEHISSERFYTSDYDLATFTSYNLGLGFRYNPFKYLGKTFLFNGMTLRYNYYQRSNGLSAHILSAAFQTTMFRKMKS
ncbi:hypothetical protein DBR32_11605 [Taibaiella sp. KBW10]|uniref:DUF3570 domain-containing protein n=1 Tax=Taibaiella sp. KBW10 TaxID=2153357 RepID=UPI000F59260A|nr:DUF3570 domain-containing protein [Taibaiella sp. KBW10]RQO30218.1 hypothetical protein DBR32_11605 [Taibaiella sp. KBW10]